MSTFICFYKKKDVPLCREKMFELLNEIRICAGYLSLGENLKTKQ